MSLTTRIFLGTTFVVVAALSATLGAAGRSARRTADAKVTKALSDALDQVDTQLEERRSALTGQAEVFAKNPDFRAIVERKKPGDLLDQAQQAAMQVGANWVQIASSTGIRVVKSNDPRADTVDISTSPFVAGALAGNSKAGYAVYGGRLYQVAAVPILATTQDNVAGVLMAARALDSTFAASLRAAGGAGVDIALFAFDTLDHPRVLASTIGRGAVLEEQIGSLTKMPPPDPARPDSLRREATINLDLAVGGTNFAALIEPLRSASGVQAGGFVVLRDKDVELTAFDRLKVVILAIGVISVFAAALLALMIGRGISSPIEHLVDAARRAADGDYTADIRRGTRGKAGALAAAFHDLLADLRGRRELAASLSAARSKRLPADGGPTGPGPAEVRTVGSVDPHRDIAPGRRFAQRYDVLEVRGGRGTGAVFTAIDSQLGVAVAIKTIDRDLFKNDPGALERFKSEIRLLRRISHRNVARTYDLGEVSGAFFVTMECVDGITLEELVRQHGPLSPAAGLSVARQLCLALEAAHAEGVVHGKIEPRKMIIAPDGLLKVIGFGFAGRASDERADIHSVGNVIYQCLTGAEIGSSAGANGTDGLPDAPFSKNPDVPPALSELVMRTAFGNPAKRPQTARELQDLLAAIS